jgi:hypothetical protein
MQVIYKHSIVAPILTNYPKTHWKNVILALAIYGIHSLRREGKLSSLTIGQIEDMCSIRQHRTNDLAVCIKELNTIKSELSKLDKRFDETHGNKQNVVTVSTKEPNTKVQPIKKPKDEGTGSASKQVACRPSSGWRTKGTTNRNSSKQMNVHPARWPKTTQDSTKNERARSTAITPMRTKCSNTVKKPEDSASKGNLRNLPSYLKNVQSMILGNIKQAKAAYMKRCKEEQLRTQQVNFNSKREGFQIKRNHTQELNKANSLQRQHIQFTRANERLLADEPMKYEPTHIANDQNNEVSSYLRKMQERIATTHNEPEVDYIQAQESYYDKNREVDYMKEADKYTGSYIIEHFSRQNIGNDNRQPCYMSDEGLKYENTRKYSVHPKEPYNVQYPRYNEMKGMLYSESIRAPEQRFYTLAKPTAVSVNVVEENVR